MLDFRNVNTLYTSIISETLFRLGLTTAIICPGSRSAPLTVAFACHAEIETIPVLDERSAAFFALGIAKRTHQPVALICTSGTAVANFFPAIIEAKESKIPLLILSADRPPELRHCHAGQTIDQVKIFGDYPHWYAELVTPSLEIKELEFLRNTIIHAYKTTLSPSPGVVHLNIPLREPLAPITQPETELLRTIINPQTFFANCQKFHLPYQQLSYPVFIQQCQDWIKHNTNGVIIAGLAQPRNAQAAEEYCRSIAILSQVLGFPILGEGLSPIRNYANLNPHLVYSYDIILRHPELATELTPEIVIQIGELPTSKQLRQWLEKTATPRWIITPDHDNFDPLHGSSQHLVASIQELVAGLVNNLKILPSDQPNTYLKSWLDLEQKTRQIIDAEMGAIATLVEPKIAWFISQTLPPATPIFIANSMPIRDVESFWQPSDRHYQIYFSRGANGIDGTLSTALGMAHHHQSSVLLTGDLALLHDTNGFLISKNLQGHLTIILINNNGGGIFANLPISKFEPPFEEYFATPQKVDFAKLAQTYSVEYQLITSWSELQTLLEVLPSQGVRILEISTDRQHDAQWRRHTLLNFAEEAFKNSAKVIFFDVSVGVG
jgi:2-succinyl-5-enolpyruvyl-6-hydroxy-3-cyclohexene-1-carboxylate synthase